MITIINLATIVLFLGLLFLLGPTVIEWILNVFTWFVPLSVFSTMFLIMDVIANVILTIRNKNSAVIISNDYENVEEQSRKNEQNKKWLRIAQITGIAGILLIFLNGPMVQIYQGWRWFVVGNKDVLAILRYMGGILFTAGLFFFAGKAYQVKKNRISEESQQPTPQSWEGYSAPPVQVFRRPDDAQIANWQQSAPRPIWQQPVQQPMPIVPYQQTMQPVQYEQRPMARWQQENMWYEEPQPAQSTLQYQRPTTYGKGKVVEFPRRKAMLDESDLDIHLPKSAWRKLFGKRKLKFS